MANTTTHVCSQEGPIQQLNAKVSMIYDDKKKVDSKMDDILKALYKSNEINSTKNAELETAFKSIEKMLSREAETKSKLSAVQDDIKKSVVDISLQVNNIETDVRYMKKDIKENTNTTNNLNKRVSVLEKVSYFVYALGALIAAIAIIVTYGHHLYSIAFGKSSTPDAIVEVP